LLGTPVVLFVGGLLAGFKGEGLAIGGKLGDIWGDVVEGIWSVVINTEVMPETISEEYGAVLAVYRYSLGAAIGGVRYAIQSPMVSQPRNRSPSNSAPSLLATIPDTHELPNPL
jgi:hypothetical protein